MPWLWRTYSTGVHGHLEVGVAKKLLNRLHVFPVCLHQGSKAVAQRVPAHRLGDANGSQRRLQVWLVSSKWTHSAG